MDFPIKHWAGFTRRHPGSFAVINTNHLAAKDHWIRATFETCNFSLILRGRGEFHRFGRVWPVEAPCVITQWPGERVDYGPLPLPHGTWEELYLTYAAETRPRFEAARLLDPDRPVWPIRDLAEVRAQAEALSRLAHAPEPASVADRVDRVAEQLILATWLPDSGEAAPAGDAATVQAILAELRARLAEPALRPESLAARHGWSASTFRRRWSATQPESPARTLQGLRLQLACRLLVESTLPVRAIATRAGFADEFYFSRRFRRELGLAPRAYRRAYLLRRG